MVAGAGRQPPGPGRRPPRCGRVHRQSTPDALVDAALASAAIGDGSTCSSRRRRHSRAVRTHAPAAAAASVDRPRGAWPVAAGAAVRTTAGRSTRPSNGAPGTVRVANTRGVEASYDVTYRVPRRRSHPGGGRRHPDGRRLLRLGGPPRRARRGQARGVDPKRLRWAERPAPNRRAASSRCSSRQPARPRSCSRSGRRAGKGRAPGHLPAGRPARKARLRRGHSP